jgi:hypothetical protein
MEHQQIETGRYGATVQTWFSSGPRDLLRHIVEANPGKDREWIFEEFRSQATARGPEFHAAILEYWFTNNYRSLAERPPSLGPQLQPTVAAVKRQIHNKIVEKAEAILLDLIMPNGKQLRSCTGAECAKAGGWLSKVGQKVGARRLVGSVMTEADLHALWRGK